LNVSANPEMPVSAIRINDPQGRGRGRRDSPPCFQAIGNSTSVAMRKRNAASVPAGISRAVAFVTTNVLPHMIMSRMRPISAMVRRGGMRASLCEFVPTSNGAAL
jgi:hypothetical protein